MIFGNQVFFAELQLAEAKKVLFTGIYRYFSEGTKNYFQQLISQIYPFSSKSTCISDNEVNFKKIQHDEAQNKFSEKKTQTLHKFLFKI